ncbi:MAG: 5'-methylthioadenosine/S-adenosylhomocysteine nucleosidase [Candidatus Aminicenantes bacterium]|nr:5'-methylthioadenosine/S-adenosylhomocysteine nucleosidase [Candidatus Aminicenantes bacterium]
MRIVIRTWGAIILLLATAIVSAPRSAGQAPEPISAAVLVSANAEWAVVRTLFPNEAYQKSPFGEFFLRDFRLPDGSSRRVLVFHGGWGKVAAAASTQYAIDRFAPGLLINFGTCGGFEGAIERNSIILADRTVIYDIIERMGDFEGAIRDYTTDIDLTWLTGKPPLDVVRGTLVSADQDLDPAAIAGLRKKYGAAAGDWESGAIAYTAVRNSKRVLILRGVTDLVNTHGGEAYGKIEVFQAASKSIMKRLFDSLPAWLAAAGS